MNTPYMIIKGEDIPYNFVQQFSGELEIDSEKYYKISIEETENE